MKLLGSAWMISLVSMGAYLALLMGTAVVLGKTGGAPAERAAFAVLSLDALVAIASVAWFARKSAALTGEIRIGWVIGFALWQLTILAVAAFISLVTLNR